MATRAAKQAQTSVTPNAIAQAKQRAIDLCSAAYAPRPVPQPNGPPLTLCLRGRIVRGYERLAAARIARDVKTVETIQGAIKSLEAKYTEAGKDAERAASDWAAMCAAAGQPVQPMECYPPPCICEGCRMEDAYVDKTEARAVYVNHLYALLCPTSRDLPPFMELGRAIQGGDTDARKRMTAHFQRIYEAGEAYAKACEDAGVSPNWRALWPDDEASA